MSGNAGRRAGGFARRSLSQNFLVDRTVARRFVQALRVEPQDVVLEIGPGKGALTAVLLEETPVSRVVGVETDPRLALELSSRFEEEIASGRLVVEHGDALRVDLDELVRRAAPGGGEVLLLSNLPYHLTSALLLRFMSCGRAFARLVLGMQKEVALRLCGDCGTRRYGRLSVMLRLYGTVERLFDIPPAAYRPVPRVTSSCLRVVPLRPRLLDGGLFAEVERLVGVAFSQRRKRVAPLIATAFGIPPTAVEEWLEGRGYGWGTRAEHIHARDYLDLALWISSLESGKLDGRIELSHADAGGMDTREGKNACQEEGREERGEEEGTRGQEYEED